MNRTRFTNDVHLREALGELADDQASPDFSRAIMGRLGYMRVNPAVARRRMVMRWMHRAATLAIVAVALAMGWKVFESSDQIRRPADTTLPQAVSHDVQHQSERIGSMIQTIRQISSPKFSPPSSLPNNLPTHPSSHLVDKSTTSESTTAGNGTSPVFERSSPAMRPGHPSGNEPAPPSSMDQPKPSDQVDGWPERVPNLSPVPASPLQPINPVDQWDEQWQPNDVRELSDGVKRELLSPVRWA